MTRLGIHHADHPALRGAAGDPPPSRPPGGLHVLARDQPQQAHRVGLSSVEIEIRRSRSQFHSVVDQLGHQPLGVGGIAPVHHRRGRAQIAFAHRHLAQFGNQPADPPDLVRHHRHSVLTGHSVVEHRGIEHPPSAASHSARHSDQLAHRVEHPIRAAARAQLVAPQSQNRGMERRLGQRQPCRGLPPHIGLQPPTRLTVRQALESLQHHHRSDHLARHRRTAPTRPEQILEQLVTEQPATMLGQQRIHRPRRHKMPAHRRRVQQHPILNR